MPGNEQGPTRRKPADPVIEVELTDDEAIAYALSMCAPGESISIHDKACLCAEPPYDCTCTPQVLTAGARA